MGFIRTWLQKRRDRKALAEGAWAQWRSAPKVIP